MTGSVKPMKIPHTSIASGWLSLILALHASAAAFVAPNEGGCTLRVDRIPLDMDTMSDLSEGLAVIVKAPVEGSLARHHRASAQALAIALALDPANDSVRKTLASFTAGKNQDTPTPESLIQARALAWQLQGWLSTEEAGNDGRLLADLMGDSLRYLDPSHPSAEALGKSEEVGNWKGWVAGLDSFKQDSKNDSLQKPEENDFDPFEDLEEKMPEKQEEPSSSESLPIQLTEASVATFVFEENKKEGGYTVSPVTVSMEARKADEIKEGFFVKIDSNRDADKIANLVAKPIYEALRASLPSEPAPGTISLQAGGKPYLYARNADNLTGPGFVLASSALSGNSPVGTIIARLGEDGKLAVPNNFWMILRGMSGEQTGRLIVPAAAEKHLLSLLTLEEKSFFLRYEVLIASTPAEMIALSRSNPSPQHAAAFAKFEAIREKGKGMSTGAFVANTFVLQRLKELAADAPYHLSAKLLAIQGAGERPRTLTRDFLAAELLLLIEPVSPILSYEMQDVKNDTISSMETIWKDLRDALDALGRLTDIRDRDLLDATGGISTSIRALLRELGKDGKYWERPTEIEDARADLRKRFTALRTGLSQTAGIPFSQE